MLSDDVIITATDKRQVKISPIILYALFMALPPNIMTANISVYTVYRIIICSTDSDYIIICTHHAGIKPGSQYT